MIKMKKKKEKKKVESLIHKLGGYERLEKKQKLPFLQATYI